MFSHQVSEALGHMQDFQGSYSKLIFVFWEYFFGHPYQSTSMKLAVNTALLTVHCTDSSLLVRPMDQEQRQLTGSEILL